jgi:hypothetical protein
VLRRARRSHRFHQGPTLEVSADLVRALQTIGRLAFQNDVNRTDHEAGMGSRLRLGLERVLRNFSVTDGSRTAANQASCATVLSRDCVRDLHC